MDFGKITAPPEMIQDGCFAQVYKGFGEITPPPRKSNTSGGRPLSPWRCRRVRQILERRQKAGPLAPELGATVVVGAVQRGEQRMRHLHVVTRHAVHGRMCRSVGRERDLDRHCQNWLASWHAIDRAKAARARTTAQGGAADICVPLAQRSERGGLGRFSSAHLKNTARAVDERKKK